MKTSLTEAIAAHVVPGEHLHFSSLPFRSNASILEIARQFRGRDPGFTVSATGFHSTAHLFPLLRLASHYISSFYGDNYPVPRPNGVYGQAERDGAILEFWSLWSYVTALRAGALGLPYGVTSSLVGTTMAEDLQALGKVRIGQDPFGSGRKVAMVRPIRPDVAFVHAHVADVDGHAVLVAPSCEGPWGALAAKKGIIVTAEQVVPAGRLADFRHLQPLPPHRVLAVCEAPDGAHPQPLPQLAGSGLAHYADDFDHYVLWRDMCRDPALFDRFSATVLEADDLHEGYADFVGRPRLEAVKTDSPPPARAGLPARVVPSTSAPPALGREHTLDNAEHPDHALKPSSVLVVLAARQIAERVRDEGYPVILAGIGQSFLACRLAKLMLQREGVRVRLMVEIGLYDLKAGSTADPFLLSAHNIAGAARLSSVEDVLGTLVCGADNRALGVVGAAQIDATGAINSTRLASGRVLVGSGGASDICSSAAEVVVLSRSSRLVDTVDYVTSPGHQVRSVVTEGFVLERLTDSPMGWMVGPTYPAEGGRKLGPAIEAMMAECPWPLDITSQPAIAPPLSTWELSTLYKLDQAEANLRRG